ncbi:MAG: pilus assembly protein PilP [Wenzhouxiangella sp.]
MKLGPWVLPGLLFLPLILTGCERGMSDLQRWVEDERQRPGQPIDSIPPVTVAEVVAYEAFDLRDPFQRRTAATEVDELVEADEVADGLRPDPNRRREFLEGFPLDTLRMVGTLQIDGVDFALIRDNENVVHRVRAGNFLGRNHGEIERVTPNRIELRELTQDGRGVWSERRVQIAMGER